MPSKLDDPAWRQERARKANEAQHSTDGLIARLAKRAPELTTEQRAELARLAELAADGGR